jgi:hypothetical protein
VRRHQSSSWQTTHPSSMYKQPFYLPTKIQIIQHNCNRSSLVINTLLDFAVGMADLLLLQKPEFNLDNTLITTHPGFEWLIPPKNLRKHNWTIAYLAKNNTYIKWPPHTVIIQDPDIQVLEITTPSIAPIRVGNIFNKLEGSSDL